MTFTHFVAIYFVSMIVTILFTTVLHRTKRDKDFGTGFAEAMVCIALVPVMNSITAAIGTLVILGIIYIGTVSAIVGIEDE